MYARRIAIVEDGYVVRKPMNQANLLFGEGCAATADYVFDTCLRHRNAIHLPFYKVTFLGSHNRMFGLENAV